MGRGRDAPLPGSCSFGVSRARSAGQCVRILSGVSERETRVGIAPGRRLPAGTRSRPNRARWVHRFASRGVSASAAPRCKGGGPAASPDAPAGHAVRVAPGRSGLLDCRCQPSDGYRDPPPRSSSVASEEASSPTGDTGRRSSWRRDPPWCRASPTSRARRPRRRGTEGQPRREGECGAWKSSRAKAPSPQGPSFVPPE